MINIIKNIYFSNNKHQYSIIIHYNNSRNILEQTLNRLLSLYSGYNLEIIIIGNNNSDASDLINNYNFSISFLDFKPENNFNINQMHNYAISLTTSLIIFIQKAECYHINNILNEINENELLDNYYSIPIIQLNSNNDNNDFYNNNTQQIAYFYNRYANNWLNNSVIYSEISMQSNFIFLSQCFCFHRKNLDILIGFKEEMNIWDFNDFFVRTHIILNIKYTNNIIVNQFNDVYTLNFHNNLENSNNLTIRYNQFKILHNKIKNQTLMNHNRTNNLLNINQKKNITGTGFVAWTNYNDNLIYKQLKYTFGVAVSIYSDNTIPPDRLEASKRCLKSIVNNINSIVIFLIDGNILDDHYNYIIELIKDKSNVELYRNKSNYGIAKTKNICIKLLEQKNVDYICLLDDDIEILKDVKDYISNAFTNLNIPIIANIDDRYKKKLITINNINFYNTRQYFYYGNLLCLSKYYIKKYGYFLKYPYEYSGDHVEITERYFIGSKFCRYCLNLQEYINNEQIINNKSQIFVHSRFIDKKKTILNSQLMTKSLKNICYNHFDFNIDEIIKIN